MCAYIRVCALVCVHMANVCALIYVRMADACVLVCLLACVSMDAFMFAFGCARGVYGRLCGVAAPS